VSELLYQKGEYCKVKLTLSTSVSSEWFLLSPVPTLTLLTSQSTIGNKINVFWHVEIQQFALVKIRMTLYMKRIEDMRLYEIFISMWKGMLKVKKPS
jgi:hypothetical protein